MYKNSLTKKTVSVAFFSREGDLRKSNKFQEIVLVIHEMLKTFFHGFD